MNEDRQLNGYREPDTFDVRSSVRAITESARRYKLVVLFTCLLTVGIVGLYIYYWPSVYSATATLMVERDSDPVRDSFYLGWNVFRKDDARTEIELMTSGPVLAEVRKREKLTYDDVYHPFFSHLTYLWQKSWIGNKYRALKKQLVGDEDTGGVSEEDLEFARTLVNLRAGVSIEPVGESNLGRVTVRGPSRRVAKIANTLVEVYLAERQERYYTEAKKSHEILTEEAQKAERELNGIEARKLAFSKQHDLMLDLQKDNLQVSRLTELESQIASTRSRIATTEASLKDLDRQLAVEPQTKVTSTMYEVNALRESGKLKRFELQTALIQARNRYREDSREVIEIKDSLAKLDALIAEASEKVEKVTTEGLNSLQQELTSRRNGAQVELEGARAGLAVMEQTADQMRTRLSEIPEMQTQLRALERTYDLSQEKYKSLLSKQAQASVSLVTARTTMPSMRAVENAVTPLNKDWPEPKYLIPGALVVGLVLGTVIAVFMSYASGRVLREHVEYGRGAAPLYGTIGALTDRRTLAVVVPSSRTVTHRSEGKDGQR